MTSAPSSSRTREILTGRLVQWDRAKGYGYLESDPGRVFLHRRDFVEWDRPPVLGERIHFIMGKDPKGRRCATEASFVMANRSPGIWKPLLLIILLTMPLIALIRSSLDTRWVFGYATVINALTYIIYKWDKHQARAGAWRVAEARLHFLELLGGWPAAYAAQIRLRHKCSKGSYKFVFWLIVIGYQFAAVDFLLDWAISETVIEWIQNAIE